VQDYFSARIVHVRLLVLAIADPQFLSTTASIHSMVFPATKNHIFIWGGLRGGTRVFWGGWSHPMPPR